MCLRNVQVPQLNKLSSLHLVGKCQYYMPLVSQHHFPQQSILDLHLCNRLRKLNHLMEGKFPLNKQFVMRQNESQHSNLVQQERNQCLLDFLDKSPLSSQSGLLLLRLEHDIQNQQLYN